MRRFFSRGKDSNGNSGQSNNSKDQPDSTKKSSNSNASANKPTHRQTEHASLSPARPNATANQPVHVDQAGPVTPSKQVAFAVRTLPATPESFHQVQHQDYEDVHSQVSYHGGTASPAPGTRSTGLGLSCFPAASTTDTRNASSGAVHTQNLLPVPSQPVRHASLDRSSSAWDRDKDATLRASSSAGMAQSPTSSTRGEIPQFGDANTNKQLPLQQLPPSQQRSGTSMSQNTSVSTSSSLLDARQAFYGSNNSSPNGLDRAYHPNLAILATYSRDMSSVNSINSGHNSIMQHLTWSEITDEQLVENLGGRERTRQEVLFEMICSEERYVQELIALKENYLQPLLERHSLSSTHFPSTHDTSLSSSTLRSLSGPSTSIDATNYHFATIKSTTSIDAVRSPFLSLSTGSTSSGLRYASPMPSTSEHGHGHGLASSSRAGHHRASETHPAASSDHLPIAARFARRISVDSPPAVEFSNPGHGNERGSTNTTCTAVDEHAIGPVTHGRRDISGGSGTTAVDSVEETNATSHGKAHSQMKKNHTKSRLHPLFSTLTSSARAAEKENAISARNLNGSSTSMDVPPPLPAKTFKHHLKSLVPPPPNKLHKVSSPDLKAGNALAGPGWVVKSLPEGLRIVASVIMEEILNGHQTLSEKLRARYEEQFPLVRSLADVFHDQAWMTEHYATYVLHLERALADIEETLALMNPLLASNRKVKSKDKEAIKEQKILAKIIMYLEEEAALKGAPGLSICISQPFQRLLKYPLLFQSLLYHTDPSTRYYDATQKLAFQIDAIVRSIENEKASEEDRSKTRDVWARIEGINDRALLSPRPDRLLVSEAAMWSSSLAGDSAVAAGRRTFSDASRRVDEVQLQAATAASKKKTARRLSDMTGIGGSSSDKKKKQPSIGSKRDVWLVTFTDVVIRCQRVGVTKLPMQSALASTGSSKITSKENHRKTVLLTTRERNLYKFQKVDRWIMEDKTSPGRAGIVSMDAMARNSRRASGKSDEDAVRPEGEDFEEVEVSGRGDIQKVKFGREGDAGMNLDGGESRMSFAYSGDEPRPVIFDIDPLVGLKLEETPPKGKSTVKATSPRAVVAASASTQQAVHKKGLAAAKFSNRLRPSTAESSNLQQARRAASPSRTTQHPPRSASATHDREKGRFSKPTAASLAKASPSTSTFLAAAGNTTNTNRLPRANESRSATPDPKRVRAASSNASPRSSRPSTSGAPMPPGLASPSKGTVRERRNSLPSSHRGSGARPLRTKHSSEKLGRRAMMESDTESGVALFNQFWQSDRQA